MPPLDTLLPPTCARIRALADRDPRRAVPLARRALELISSADTAGRAWAHYTLGWALLWWERFDQARPHLHAAREHFEASTPFVALHCRFALTLADLLLSASPTVERDLDLLALQFEQHDAALDAARCRMYQAILFNIQGRARAAGELLQAIGPIMAAQDTLDHARWLRVRGATASSLHDYAAATRVFAEAEASFARHGARLDRAKCWAESAWCALGQEQLDRALAGYERAERAFRQLDMPARQAICARESGLLLLRAGVYDQALERILRAKTYFTPAGRTRDIAGCDLQLGNLYYYTGSWAAALAAYRRADTLYATAALPSECAIARRNCALVYRAMGDLATAQQLLADLEAQADALGYRAELAAIWHEQADIAAGSGQHDTAMALYQRARELFLALGKESGGADCAIEQGWLALQHGRLADAEAHFRFAVPLVRAHPHHRWRAGYGLARCAVARGALNAALDHYATALATVAGLRGRLASEAISSQLYAQAAQLHVDALRLAAEVGATDLLLASVESQRALVLQKLLAGRQAGDASPYQAEIERQRSVIEALVDQERDQPASAAALDAALAAYGELLLHARHTSSRPTSLDTPMLPPFELERTRRELNAMYGSGWTALIYTWNGDRFVAITVTPNALDITDIPDDAELRDLLRRATDPFYRRHTYRDVPYLQGQSQQRWACLHRLAERLLPQRVRARLEPEQRLLIAPTGQLHALPWGALRLDSGWLAEQAIVQLIPSLSIWQALAEQPAADARAALLVGCSEFAGRAPDLPAVRPELAVVGERWPGEVVELVDAQANRAELLNRSACGELEQYRLVHLASHARMLPRRGLAAHVKLWDGNLLLSEVAALRLGGALVVLSACDGAAADPLPGDEIVSLSWAFLAAGASGVLASLWRIPDSLVPQIMTAFYNALRTERDAGLALTRAQRALIAGAASETDPIHGPEVWASFVLTGVC